MTDISNILKSVGLASYTWDIRAGVIDWSENFRDLAGFKPGVDIAEARNFETLLSSDSPQTRFAAIYNQQVERIEKSGMPYQCTYAVRSKELVSGETLWIEDTGRWFADENGKPQRAEGIVRIINERRKRDENLKRKSEVDELTGLANRRMLQEAIGRTANDCFNQNKSAAFILISLNDFERINHIYGFQTGDQVLRQVADILNSYLRNHDLAARFSGAKFGLILRDCNEQKLKVAAKRFIDELNGRIVKTASGPVSLKVCIGACLLPHQARSDIDAISAATLALDLARNSFGANVQLYKPDSVQPNKQEQKSKLLTKFVDAIENEAIRLAFQPIVSASTGLPTFHEALLRIENIGEEIINNAEFIHLAEELGFMRMLDEKALCLAVQTLQAHPDAHLSINVNHDTLESGNWLNTLHSELAKQPNLASRLIVELTESHLPRDINGTKNAAKEIKQLGCKLALDDFGAGYSSFSHIRDLEFDLLKIDGSFARDLASNPANEIFLKSASNLAASFGMKTIVEWVEDIDTAVKLKEWGHDYFQGSLYGMPLSVVPWVKNSKKVSKHAKMAG